MNAQSSNNSSSTSIDLSAITSAMVAEQTKIAKAIEAVKAQNAKDVAFNNASKAAADRLVSQIQKDLNAQLINLEESRKNTYAKAMTELGLSAEVYPLETAQKFIDEKAITPVLAGVGTASRKVADIGKSIGSRFMMGFKKDSK